MNRMVCNKNIDKYDIQQTNVLKSRIKPNIKDFRKKQTESERNERK